MSWTKAIPPKMLHDHFGVYQGNWMPEMERCWIDFDRGYQVCSRMIKTEFGNVEHATITRLNESGSEFTINTGGSAPIGWNEKMMIKNELFGKNRFAIEVYPKEKNLVDVTDTYHLWVFDKKKEMPFGIHPKEHVPAINRGYSISQQEVAELQKLMDRQKAVPDKS